MKHYLFLGLVLYVQVNSICGSESSNDVTGSLERTFTLQNCGGLSDCSSEVQSLSIDVPRGLDTAQSYYISVVGDLDPNAQYTIIEGDSQTVGYPQDIILRQVPSTISQVQLPMPMPMPMQTTSSMVQFGRGDKVQWVGGPVNFDNMVDCKFYRQNPGFCVPMSIYTPCSRCKAGVRTIFRTSYKVRCPSQDSFPPQLRPYFTWVPTSHRNPKMENKLFSRWRRQFMCIVMAISDVPRDLSQFWQHSQISFDSATSAAPQSVPLLLGPYGDQSTSFGYTTGSSYPVLDEHLQGEYRYDAQPIYTIN